MRRQEEPTPSATSVMPYVSYNDQESVLIEGIDLAATLKVAEAEFARELSTSELPIWAIRDQVVTPEIAAKIARAVLRQYRDALYYRAIYYH